MLILPHRAVKRETPRDARREIEPYDPLEDCVLSADFFHDGGNSLEAIPFLIVGERHFRVANREVLKDPRCSTRQQSPFVAIEDFLYQLRSEIVERKA